MRNPPLSPTLLAIPAAALVAVFQASLFEWVYHRYWLHRPWLPPQMFTAHTLVHHQLCKHDDTFVVTEEEQEEALTFQWWAGPVLVAINVLPWLAAWWALGARVAALPMGAMLGAFAGTYFLYYLAYEGFHYLMHKPSIAWIERSAFFRFLEKHHRIHHVHMGTNFNVVLPLADAMFGTLKLRDEAPKRVTEPGAKRVARRHSQFGKRLREQGTPEAASTAASEREAEVPAEV